MIRIGFIISKVNGGGREKRAIELAVRLSKIIKLKVAVVSTDVEILNIKEYLRSFGVDSFYVEKFNSIRFYQLINSQGFCILHTWGFVETLFTLPFKIFGYKIVNSAITGHPKGFKFSKLETFSWSFILGLTDFSISNSWFCINSFSVTNNTSVIDNSVDIVACDVNRPLIASKFDLSLSKRYVLMLANAKDGKLFDELLLLADIMGDVMSDVVFILAGNGVISKFHVQCSEKDNVILFDYLNRECVNELQSFCDVGLLFSDTEGQSNSVVEFMARSKPVIVVEDGGMDGFLIHKINSIYHRRFNLNIISRDLIEILNDSKFREFLIFNATKTITERCDPSTNALKYFNIYRRLI